MTIIRLNGTHGSGKSTVAYRLLRKYPHHELRAYQEAKKPAGYVLELPARKTLAIVGPYTSACGGCDAVQPFSDIWPAVKMFAKHADHVFFEGALVSTTYGGIGAASEAYGADFVFAFMDTPLAVCVARVNARRAERGAPPLIDTKNVDSKWYTVDRLRQKLEAGVIGKGQRTAIIDCAQPTKAVLALLGVKTNKEPL